MTSLPGPSEPHSPRLQPRTDHHPTVGLPTGPPTMGMHGLGWSLGARSAPFSLEDQNTPKPPASSALPLPVSWPLAGPSRWKKLWGGRRPPHRLSAARSTGLDLWANCYLVRSFLLESRQPPFSAG